MRPSAVATGIAIAATAAVTLCAQDVYVTLCRTHFVVTDAQGHVVTSLGRADVVVYDNDVAQDIAEFAGRHDAPMRAAVVLDRSRSVSDRFPLVITAATSFATTALREPDDEGLVVAFDSKVYLLQDWTADRAAIVDSIRGLTAAGGTAVFDALFKTCRDRLDDADTRQKAIVLVSDGDDTTSVATFDQTLAMTRRSQTVVYVIGLHTENSMNERDLQGQRVLARLADLTGGRVFYPDDRRPDALATMLATVEEEIRGGYDISYYLHVPPDNAYHRIRVEPKDKALTVRAPSGYFAWKLTPAVRP